MAISLLLPVVSTRWPSALDSAMRITPRTRAWRFSAASPLRSSSAWNASTIGCDRHRPGVQALPLDQVLGVGDRVPGGVPAGHEHHVHQVGAERVGRDGGGQRGVDPAGQGEDDRAEAVLAHVVPHPGDQRRVDLRQRIQPRPHRPAGVGGVRRASPPARGADGHADPVDRHRRAVVRVGGRVRRRGRGPAAGRSRSATTSASSNCGPRASSRPSASTMIESPSKTSSSWPPIMLT